MKLATSTWTWMNAVLALAGFYNLAWGGFVVLAPLRTFEWAHMAPPNYPELWQCIGMIVGVYGVGYLVAAANPLQHWPIVLVGLLGKVFGPIGFLQAYQQGRLPVEFGLTLVFNDLIWWIPFALILRQSWLARRSGWREA